MPAAVASMGHTRGMRVTAAGAETEQQLALVRDAQCDEALGFFWDRPMPAADLGDILAPAA